MATRYSAGTLTSAAPALNTAFAELRAPTRRLHLLQLEIYLGAATATNFALTRSTVVGTGGSNAQTGLPEDTNAPAGTGTLQANAFTTAPTFSLTAVLKRGHLAASIGGGVLLVWPESDPLIIPAAGSLVIYTPVIAGAASISVSASWQE